MGAACCCMRAEYEDLASSNNTAVYRNWFCLRGFLQSFLQMYTLLLQRGDEHARSSSTHGMTSLSSSSSSIDNSSVDMYRSPPRPMPYDADPRYFHSQQEEIVAKREKASTNLHEETEPLKNIGDEGSESVGNKVACEKGSKHYISEIDLQLLTAKTSPTYPFLYTYSYAEECPTCLEEYTIDNPKIVTKCSHHFHLGCIYEWMERSDKCPVCEKVMDFDEAI